MKRIYFIILVCFLMGFPVDLMQGQIVEISGKVKNIKNKKPLINAEISITGTNIGTVTNSDGYFSLKFPEEVISNGLKVDLIGYVGVNLPIPKDSTHQKDLSILLTPSGKVLDEVLVYGGDPKDIVAKALEKIPDNYSLQNNVFQGFYRETVRKGNRYISISEAMVNLLKKPYSNRNTKGDKISIYKGRRLLSPKVSDTLSIKLMDGPLIPINFDAVKNGEHLFTNEEIDNFKFTMLPITIIENRPHYSIEFKPYVELSYPLHQGVFYIDTQSLAISRVEFNLDMKNKSKVTQAILQKKPRGLRFKPIEVSGVVTYKTHGGKSYINYVSTKIKFNCDWKRHLFASTYTTVGEMVMVDRSDSPQSMSQFANTYGKRKIFSDMVDNYWEQDFWKDYNIIEPSESLEKAVNKLKKIKK